MAFLFIFMDISECVDAMIRLGFHLSVAGGVQNSALTAEKHRYGTFQIFASNPRAWEHHRIKEEDAEAFNGIIKRTGAIPFAHVPYLCNPSSGNKEMLKKSLQMLIGNMESCNLLKITGLVVHQGSHLGEGSESGVKTIVETMRKAAELAPDVRILLENSSGYKNSVGSKFEEIGGIIDKTGSDRIGVCLDTCHAFAAGYDLSTKEGIADMCKSFEDNIGFKRLGLVHLNDAKYGLGSGLDRHWHIGKGNIGVQGFTELFKNRHFHDGCFIMETPINEDGDEASNMRNAKKIVADALGRA